MHEYSAVPTPKCNHILNTDSETLSNIIIPPPSPVLQSPCQNSGFFHILLRCLHRVSFQRSLLTRGCSSVSLHSWKMLEARGVGRKLEIPAPPSPAPSGTELHDQPEHITSFELLQYIKWGKRFYFIQEHPHERSFKSFHRLWNLCH